MENLLQINPLIHLVQPQTSPAFTAGLVAMVLAASSFAVADAKRFRLQLASSGLFWAVHFFMLGAVSAAALSLAASARLFYSWAFRPDGGRSEQAEIVLVWLSVSLYASITALTWQGPVSLLPFAAMANASFAASAENLLMRKRLLISSAFWIANGLCWGSIPQLLCEIAVISLNIATIRRLSPLRESRSRLEPREP